MHAQVRVLTFVVLSAVLAHKTTLAQEFLDDLVLAAWMQGDSINSGGTVLTYRSILGPIIKPVPQADVPAGGGSARLRISDNNKALPQDRIYFSYNHFHNAFMVQPGAGSGLPAQQSSVSRYTVGFEKTVFSDAFSVEVRAPVMGTYQFFSGDFGVRGSNAGNLAVITKRLLHRNEASSSVFGLGLSLPTGTDVNGNVQDVGYVFQNEAVHFVPYLGYLGAPNESSFFHAFLTTDFAANGNPIFASTFGQNNVQLGTLTPQALMSFDVGAGQWIYRNQNAPSLTGIAAMLELHYTTTLSDADEIGTVIDTTLLEFGNRRNRSDVVNMTVGLHFEFNLDTSLRVGAALPLTEDPDRDFDAEVLAQFIHRFGATQSRGRRSGVAGGLGAILGGRGRGRGVSPYGRRTPSRVTPRTLCVPCERQQEVWEAAPVVDAPPLAMVVPAEEMDDGPPPLPPHRVSVRQTRLPPRPNRPNWQPTRHR